MANSHRKINFLSAWLMRSLGLGRHLQTKVQTTASHALKIKQYFSFKLFILCFLLYCPVYGITENIIQTMILNTQLVH